MFSTAAGSEISHAIGVMRLSAGLANSTVCSSASIRRATAATLNPRCASLMAIACPNPLEAPVTTAIFGVTCAIVSALYLRHFHPFAALLRLQHAINHRLHPCPVHKTRPAIPLLMYRRNKLKILVIPERHQRIALMHIARRVGHLPELFRHRNRLQSALALL